MIKVKIGKSFIWELGEFMVFKSHAWVGNPGKRKYVWKGKTWQQQEE